MGSEPRGLGSSFLIFNVDAVCGSLENYVAVQVLWRGLLGAFRGGETGIVEMPFGAQFASCTLAESIHLSGFTPSCLLIQHAWFCAQRTTYSRN